MGSPSLRNGTDPVGWSTVVDNEWRRRLDDDEPGEETLAVICDEIEVSTCVTVATSEPIAAYDSITMVELVDWVASEPTVTHCALDMVGTQVTASSCTPGWPSASIGAGVGVMDQSFPSHVSTIASPG